MHRLHARAAGLWFGLLQALLLVGLILAGAASRADDFLEPEQAFRLSGRAADAATVIVRFDIAPGYYMYRDQFKISAEAGKIGAPVYPKGKIKFDEAFQKNVETFREAVEIRVPVQEAQGMIRLSVTGQGCADKGLCYPPMTQPLAIAMPAPAAQTQGAAPATESGAGGSKEATAEAAPPQSSAGSSVSSVADPGTRSAASETGALEAALQSGRFWPVVALFFVAGLLLSLTPCVLPMLPILSAIITGEQERPSRRRGLLLAVSYSLGMALVYTALGVAAGLAGEGLAANMQKPWVLGLFAALLALFSLSMFGVYELRLPGGLSGGLTQASQRLPAGRVVSVFAMGGVSALIVSPCVAAPLAGAMLYLSQTRDVVLGGSALFALASGMSVPLLLLGVSAGTLLPRAGPWMDGIKHFFGMLLLGVALWTVQPVLPAAIAQALWGALLIASSAMLGLFEQGHAAGRPRTWLRKTSAVVAMVYGLLQLLGAAAGGTDPLKPLAAFALGERARATVSQELTFRTVTSIEELDQAVASAGRPVMLDFYADWCVSCKEMDRFTFADAGVRERLSKALLLRADVTANNAADKALLKRFKLFGPPGIIFFDAKGQELNGLRVVGYQDVARFSQTLSAAGL